MSRVESNQRIQGVDFAGYLLVMDRRDGQQNVSPHYRRS
jgi:hypothetical protein